MKSRSTGWWIALVLRQSAGFPIFAVCGERCSISPRGRFPLSRPVRLLHPRIPLYIVPREPGRFMVGATMIETEDAGAISARSMMEFLNAAYAVHPAFAEAEIIETGTGVRPAYPDNLPKITQDGRTIFINGAYRHGFLLSPAMARQAAEIVCQTLSKGTGP